MSSSTVGKMQKLKGILADPGNRPAVSLLMYSSVAMAVVPLAVYFACFNIVFAEGVSPSTPLPPSLPSEPPFPSSARDVAFMRCRAEKNRVERDFLHGVGAYRDLEAAGLRNGTCPLGTTRRDEPSPRARYRGDGKEGAQYPCAATDCSCRDEWNFGDGVVLLGMGGAGQLQCEGCSKGPLAFLSAFFSTVECAIPWDDPCFQERIDPIVRAADLNPAPYTLYPLPLTSQSTMRNTP